MQAGDQGRLTVAMPKPADGRSPAVSAHLVQSVPDGARREVMSALDLALPPDANDPLTKTISVLLREMVSSVLSTGGIDAAAAVDTPTEQPRDGKRLPDVTAGVRVKDGPALEKQLKQAVAAGSGGQRLLPEGVTMKFDTGKVGKAMLHSISIDLRGTDAADDFGDTLELTLAVTPDYAFLLAGGDPKQRLESLLGPNGRLDADRRRRRRRETHPGLRRRRGLRHRRARGREAPRRRRRADRADEAVRPALGAGRRHPAHGGRRGAAIAGCRRRRDRRRRRPGHTAGRAAPRRLPHPGTPLAAPPPPANKTQQTPRQILGEHSP
jgi:hypothetical protein